MADETDVTKKYTIADKLKMVFMLMYFLILTVERVISLVSVFTGNFAEYNGLDWYMTALTILAIFGSYCFIITNCRLTVKHYENGKTSACPVPDDSTFGKLSIAAGILLLGGMVHTHGTIPGIQFASYGMILVAMAIHTAQSVKAKGNADRRWLSFAYIVAYSMAIPVVYQTGISLSWLFVPLEVVVSAGMVVLFTIMLKHFFENDGDCTFSLPPFLVALIGDFLVLALRWYEEVNVFVLIFICITTVLWFAGSVLSMKRGRK